MSKAPVFDEQEFESTSVFVDVLATNCLYFAWAEAGFQGPEDWPAGGREQGDPYRPQQVIVDGYDQVRIRVSYPERYWRHGAPTACRSQADGRDVEVQTDSRYRSTTYRSEHIRQQDPIKLNALVAMFGGDFNNPPTAGAPADVLYVGLDATLSVPDGAKHLYLGMHDGYEWSNNSNDDGVMTVEIMLAKRRRK